MKKLCLLKKHFSIIYILLILGSNICGNSNNSDDKLKQCGQNYMVHLEKNNKVTIIDLKNLKVKVKSFPYKITKIENCLYKPYFDLTILTGTDNANDYKRIIYHLGTDREYKGFDIGINEKRWSQDGKYTFFNDIISFTLVKTKELIIYLDTDGKNGSYIKINGHPLGVLHQENWQNRYLLYSNGVGDGPICWGLLDVVGKSNYLLDCCGMRKNTKFNEPCTKNFLSKDGKYKILPNSISENKILKISNNFYNDVLRILNSETAR